MSDQTAMPPYLRTMLYGLLGFTTLAVAFMIARPAPPVAPAVEKERTSEQAVWAAMIQAYGKEGILADSTGGRHCPDCPRPADVPAELWESFVQRNRTPVSLRARLPTELRAKVGSDSPRPEGRNCRGPTVLVLSRVGFSADGSLALASYDLNTGPGPYPRCGYATGFMVLLRKGVDGSWHQAGTTGGYIT